ncbi:MAG: nucleotide-binding protein, PIN domain-containing protein [Verrucomicrobiae bacterium]|nr:nucleotide-binding protein, PIN domain-containing protein [Verrucomicrobiae bacterium]
MRVVVDANIAFRALCRARGDLRASLSEGQSVDFFAPFFVFVELFKHKERIEKQSRLPEEDVLNALHELCESLNFIHESDIPVGTWMEAHRLTGDIDPKDTPYVALSLHLSASLWTYDKALEEGLRGKGFEAFWSP